jgi:hypothetical protein
MNQQIVDGLKKARTLIENPNNWVNHAPSPEEISKGTYCLVEALTVALNLKDTGGLVFAKTLDSIRKLIVPEKIVSRYNDSHSHSQILDLIDLAIKQEEEEKK